MLKSPDQQQWVETCEWMEAELGTCLQHMLGCMYRTLPLTYTRQTEGARVATTCLCHLQLGAFAGSRPAIRHVIQLCAPCYPP